VRSRTLRPRTRAGVPDRAALVALGLGLAGLAYRIWLLVAGTPPTNSDEAVMGLAALHILRGHDFPVFFYGQQYMGTLEAYLAVPFFAVFGPSTLALRVPTLLCYVAFVALMYALTRRLYPPWLATVTVGLLALGADRVVKDQLIAAGGYPELLPAGALLVLLTVRLASGPSRWRLATFAAWGLIAGLLVWDDLLIAPYLLAAGLLLAGACWRELCGWAGLALGVAALAGMAPLIVASARAPAGQGPLATYLAMAAGFPAPLGARLDGALLTGVPLAGGLCPPGACGPAQRWWGVAFPVLLLVAGVLAVRRLAGPTARPPQMRRAQRVRQAARLALVAAAVLTIVLYGRNPSAAYTPTESARYLSCLQISTPAALWPLWLAATRVRPVPVRVAAAGALAAVVALMLVATGALVARMPTYRTAERQALALTDRLEQMGVRHVYSKYWTCYRITFDSTERVVCATITAQLWSGLDRYPPYPDAAAADPRPAYVAPVDDPLDGELRAYFDREGVPVTVTEVAGYRIYRPPARVALPFS
jgi:hypothetical protein